MNVAQYLAYLVVPINLSIVLIVLGVLAFMLKRRKTAVGLFITSLFWVLIWSLPITSMVAGGNLEKRYQPLQVVDAKPLDAIVILGGNTANNRHNWFEPYDPDNALSRTKLAKELYLYGLSSRILLSGAALDGTVSDTQIMAKSLVASGVPAENLILETDSHTTYENALFTSQLMHKYNINSIFVVTSALHMPRAMSVFKNLGVNAVAAPSYPQINKPKTIEFSPWKPNLRALHASRTIIKEYAGLFIYWIRGWI